MSRYKTPLRYPGGKQKLAPFIADLMRLNRLDGGHYVEPYAGGSAVALELLFSGVASHVHLNDSCDRVYAFWRAILTRTDEFCALISRASLTVEEWRRQREILRNPREHSIVERGFSAFYLNRCNRSGILSGGLIGGLNQSGPWKMDARFPRNELIRRVEAVAYRKSSITFKHLDAETFLSECLSEIPRRSLVYLDPPYYHKADRLYMNHYQPADHERIAKKIQQKIRQHWIVSYDRTPEIERFYSKRRSYVYNLRYSAAAAGSGTEIVIFRDGTAIPPRSLLPHAASASY